MEYRWSREDYNVFRKELLSNQDEEYRLFQEKLLRSSLPVIGIRIPILRKKAKEIAKVAGKDFFALCQKDTFEERLLYGLVAAALPMEFQEFISYCDTYSNEYVENWAHCDTFCASLKKIVVKNEEAFFEHAKGYLKANNPWVVRVGLIILLDYYLKEPYLQEVLRQTDGVDSDFYYIQMGQAWLLATAWAKDPEMVREYLGNCGLSYEVKSKFVQKACDSYRVSLKDKAWLREWRKIQKEGR
ncbi:DNA alkylation repair protein [Anaerotignum sp. MB30-C6]|uniref:DNA alkylation repair protein n=1 Tax=Anaerotignum sp. MB30-C6 TaxID=3070814 RepID=UPI0027DCFF6E|nr:DNA alkylation repair protein [Anaerotignum sp. MB30-C6]WMI80831.1 DNA alkylation repair protein [Anaerotignum sp. MB30-C6]